MSPTHEQIAADIRLWNEYFNTDAAMSDEEFHAMSLDDRLALLREAFGDDENEAV